jgi:hypothetical protein
MKILLIGEFSGVHTNLKTGLTKLGHEVTLAAAGDWYRKFEYDIPLAPYEGRFIGRLMNVFYFIRNIRQFIHYDVIQFINPFSLPYYYLFFGLTSIVFRFNKKTVYYACGTDPNFIKAKNKFKYFPFDDKTSEEYYHYNLFSKFYFNYFIKKIDIIIPAMYSYSIGYNGHNKLTPPIPLPGGAEKGKIKKIFNRISILHGITRRNFKGSEFILNALDTIKAKYPEKVAIKIAEGLQNNEYKAILEKTDIVVDQCKSYDYGMNAILSMERGCIVLSGSEDKAMEYLGFNRVPVINILPNEDDIVYKIENLLLFTNDQLYELKLQSRLHVTRNHNQEDIALKFINTYNHIH